MPTDTPITEKTIRDAMLHHIFDGSALRAHNIVGIGPHGHEMDVLRILKSGYAEEYEIKLTAADIKAEAKKAMKHAELWHGNECHIDYVAYRNTPEQALENAKFKVLPSDAFGSLYIVEGDRMRTGKTNDRICIRVKCPIRRFYVAVPTPELAAIAEASFPAWAGILLVKPRLYHGGVQVIRKAKDLPNSRKVTDGEKWHVALRMATRYYQQYFERGTGQGRK